MIVEERFEEPGEACGEEVEVFKDSEDAKVDGDRQCTPPLRDCPIPRSCYPLCNVEINQGGDCDQEQETSVPCSVEHVACHEEHAILSSVG